MMDRYIIFVADRQQTERLEHESSSKLSMKEALHEVRLLQLPWFCWGRRLITYTAGLHEVNTEQAPNLSRTKWQCRCWGFEEKASLSHPGHE